MSATPLKRQDGLMALALTAVVILAASWRLAPGVCGKLHDDAIYVSTAKALATGQGYRQIHLPEAPLQTKYPILYPTLLSVVWRIWPDFPANLIALQAVGMLSAAAAAALGYLYLVRFNYASRTQAAAASLICGVTPLWLYFAVNTMAETLFALLLIVALWGVELIVLDADDAKLSKCGQFLWGAALALPFLCRTIGLIAIAAGLFVVWRHRRPLRWYAAGAMLTALPWLLWSLQGCGAWQHDPINGYYTDYLGSWTTTGASCWSVIRANTFMIAYGAGLLSLEGLAGPLVQWLGAAGGSLALVLMGLAPWLAMMPDLGKVRALPWLLVAYLAAMLVWPWPPLRFLVPILPFLVVYLCLACAAVVIPRADRWTCRAVGLASAAALVAANIALLASHAQHVRQTAFPVPRLNTQPAVLWSSYDRLFSWLDANSHQQDVIAASLDSMIGLYTGRPAFRPFAYDPGYLFYGEHHSSQSCEDLAAALQRRRAAYLVLSPTPDLTDEQVVTEKVNELRARFPDWLKKVYQDADTRFIVYKLRAQHQPTTTRSAMLHAP
jgi:hypothetical protein